MKLLRGRRGKDSGAEHPVVETPEVDAELDQREIDDQIAALREAVEAELDARARASSIVAVPLAANGRGDGRASTKARRLDRYAVSTISWTLTFWVAGLGVAAIVGILVAYFIQ